MPSVKECSVAEALYIYGRADARVAPFNLREGQLGQVLLDVAAVGLCGSNLHYYKDGHTRSAVIQSPFVPGHEFAGYLCVDLEDLGLERGSLVAVDPNKACGHCAWCREGHPNVLRTMSERGSRWTVRRSAHPRCDIQPGSRGWSRHSRV